MVQNDEVNLRSVITDIGHLGTCKGGNTRANSWCEKKDYDQTVFMFRQIHAIVKNH